jgi:hypothetical protein
MKTTSVKQKVRIGASIITALVMGSAFPALADSSATVKNKNGTPLAEARFSTSAHRFYIKDLRPDGRGVYLDWIIPSTGQTDKGKCFVDGGSGSDKTCHINVPRDKKIQWTVSADDVDGDKKTYKETRTDRT